VGGEGDRGASDDMDGCARNGRCPAGLTTKETKMKKRIAGVCAILWACAGAAAAQGQVNVICSVQADWCHAVQEAFTKATGVKVNMVLMGSGEGLAQLMAGKDNPKTDVWFGGTGDPHLLAAQQALTMVYKSPTLPQLYSWAQRQAEQSGYRTVGIYSGPLGFAYNTEILAQKKLPVPATWSDLLNPAFKGEIQVANPTSSGTAYTMIATLVQVMGEDKAFAYLKQLDKNVSSYPRSGTAPIKAVARGEAGVSISFVHDAPMEAMQGFPIKTVTPGEGTGAEVGSMSIVERAPHQAEARKFYEWALTPAAQALAAQTHSYQLPSNKATKVDANVPSLSSIRLIEYDYAKYGKEDERRRLIHRWEAEVQQAHK
jgi:iron(III) transport system substrate-binding protein